MKAELAAMISKVDSLTHPEMLVPVEEGHSGQTSAIDESPEILRVNTPASLLPKSFKEKCCDLAFDPV